MPLSIREVKTLAETTGRETRAFVEKKTLPLEARLAELEESDEKTRATIDRLTVRIAELEARLTAMASNARRGVGGGIQ